MQTDYQVPGIIPTQEFLKMAERGDLQGVMRGLSQGGAQRIYERSPKGSSLLHKAAYSGSVEVINFVLDSGLQNEINRTNLYGETPILIACRRGNFDAAVLLARRGGDPTATSEFYQFKSALDFKAGASNTHVGLSQREINIVKDTADDYIRTRRRIPQNKPPMTIWQQLVLCWYSAPTL